MGEGITYAGGRAAFISRRVNAISSITISTMSTSMNRFTEKNVARNPEARSLVIRMGTKTYFYVFALILLTVFDHLASYDLT